MSLVIGVTAIAESAMHFISITLLALKLDATLGSHSDLCIVQCGCLFDLLFDDSKCVHEFTPEILGLFNPRSFSRLRPNSDYILVHSP